MSVKIELFPAIQWRSNYRPGRQNVYPRPPSRPGDFWEVRFRLRVDGRWYKPEGRREKYVLFTGEEVGMVVEAQLLL